MKLTLAAARISVTVFFGLACATLGFQARGLVAEQAPAPAVVPVAVLIPATPAPTALDYTTHCDAPAPTGFNRMVEDAAKSRDLDPRVLAQTAYRESDCRQDALGGSGEIGLTQVNPSVWTETLVDEGIIDHQDDLWDPMTNLQAGAFILSEMSKAAKGDPQETFRRYNGSGPKARRYARAQMRDFQANWGSTPDL